MKTETTHFKSPFGWLELEAEENHLKRVNFCPTPEPPKDSSLSVLQAALKQLKEYFSGQRTEFELPLMPEGTDFQKKCWKILQTIPYGKTISYEEQAILAGGKNYTRAVGGANGKNPIAIIVPCHRVIGKNGELTGFASGVDKKRQLLDLEADAEAN